MDRNREEEGGGKPDKKTLESVAKVLEKQQSQVRGEASKGKSCKGCLYYSSNLKSKGKNPRCIGIPRTLQQVVPNYVGKTEEEASKDGRALSEFYYACVGYSVFINKNRSTGKQASPGDLPLCVGLELLVDRRVNNTNKASTPAQVMVTNFLGLNLNLNYTSQRILQQMTS
ncbi:hypothetical protein Tsubulata_016167 [Turnera subulata]|uniref:DUF8204 domain-containing protein n=1 Tax=Turnera subulata TaxID=218843 RepID=A0A9Q0GMT0_9ROSI|nr:hypothetical protein Tsubulata_016167 [Turnera subulata]